MSVLNAPVQLLKRVSEFQLRIEPTTSWMLVGCSNHWARIIIPGELVTTIKVWQLVMEHGPHCTKVRTPWLRAKYFPVRLSHSVNKYIILFNPRNSKCLQRHFKIQWQIILFSDNLIAENSEVIIIKKMQFYCYHICFFFYFVAGFQRLWMFSLTKTCLNIWAQLKLIPSTTVFLHLFRIRYKSEYNNEDAI